MDTFQFLIKIFLREIQSLQASLDSLNRLIKNELKKVDNYKEKNVPIISYSHLALSDITEEHNSEWEINYSSGLDSNIEADNYDRELNRIISSEAGFLISQCYERLETFIKDSLALHLYFIGAGKLSIDKNLDNLTEYFEFKDGIRKIRSKNNADLFKILRKTCPLYSQYEVSNNVAHNLYDWYQVYSVARHAIVHQSSVLNKEQLSTLSEFKRDLLRYFFPGTFYQDSYRIEIPYTVSRKTIKRIAEFGFTIFKALSIHNHKPWKILKK